jgi:glycopeptide antibiotics resistance protein
VIIAAGTLPLGNFSGHPHWGSFRWTVRPEDWHSGRFYFDVIANVGLFYPLGLLMARHWRSTPWLQIGLLGGAGLLFSAGIEGYQIFCHNRRPSLIDVASNTSGTMMGLLTASWVFASDRLNKWLPACYSHPTGS